MRAKRAGLLIAAAAVIAAVAAMSQTARTAPAVTIPGAVRLVVGSDIPIDVRSNGVAYRGTMWHLVRLAKARFTLGADNHLAAVVTGGLTTFDDVDYEVHAAVMDADGRLLGTAHAPVHVQRVWLAGVEMMQCKLSLDFGVSRAYPSAKQFSVAITDRKVLTPEDWQK